VSPASWSRASSTGVGSSGPSASVETIRPSTNIHLEPGSFRDWDGRVFSADGRILRALSETGLADWEALAASELFGRLTGSGELVATEQADADVVDELRLRAGFEIVDSLELPSETRVLYHARPV